MVRRKSNQRITKIKIDTVLDLLERAEKTPVENAVVVNEAGRDLTPYPDLNNMRGWIRKYLLKGISGVFCNKSELTELSSRTDYANQFKGSTNYFTTVLDGLILNTQEYKLIHNKTSNLDEYAPKPGLQLSNLYTEVIQKSSTGKYYNNILPVRRSGNESNDNNNYYQNNRTRCVIGTFIHNFLISYIPTYGIFSSFPEYNSYKYYPYLQFNSVSRTFIKESNYIYEYQGIGYVFPKADGAVDPPTDLDYWKWNFNYYGFIGTYQSVTTYDAKVTDENTSTTYYIPWLSSTTLQYNQGTASEVPTWWTNIYSSPKTMNVSTGSEIWNVKAIDTYSATIPKLNKNQIAYFN